METVSRELQLLSTKQVPLSSPGTKLNDLYYSRINSTVELVECNFSNGRFQQSLSSAQFGSQSQVNIPNGSFLGSTYLHLELPNVVANQTLCRGWGIAAIREISFLFGSSNVSQLTITGQSLFQLMMAQSETSDKTSEYFRLGGEELTAPLVAVDGVIPTVCADILLPLPWSNSHGLFSKLPFDTSMLKNPVTITVSFNPDDHIYGGTGVRPSGFTSAVMTFRQGDLSNNELSLANQLNMDRELMYGYPFIHCQSFQSQKFTGARKGLESAVSVQLQGFINSDLVGIIFGVVRDSRRLPGSNNSPSKFAYDQITDINITRNGQVIYYAPYKQYKLLNMNSMMGASYCHNSVIAAGTTSPFNSAPVDTYCVYIDFSRERSTQFSNTYFNTMRIPNQVIDLSFQTETTEQYTLYATYLFNAINEVQRQESRIIFT